MTSGSPALAHVRGRVDRALQTFASQQSGVLLAAGEALRPGAESIAGLLASGKRLRPAFCYWGWRGAGGPDCPEIINAAAALELLHAGALVHDDLMDASDTRRGQPSVHRQFEARHAARRWHGSAGVFGMGMAILLAHLLDRRDVPRERPARGGAAPRPPGARPDAHRGVRRAVP